jgi:ABC-type antimicrobial peptide transport system ATPase subunit
VPLATQLHIPQETTLAQWLQRSRSAARDERAEIEDKRETRAVPALEALAQHRQLTLLGAAGSGKSTFGASVLLALAQAWQGHDEELADLGESGRTARCCRSASSCAASPSSFPRRQAGARRRPLGLHRPRPRRQRLRPVAETMKYVQRIARDHGALILSTASTNAAAKPAAARARRRR